MVKRIKSLLAALLLLTVGTLPASAQMVVLHYAGHQVIGHSVEGLDSITFERHAWVDLALPSGTLWATCNVGADRPEEFGDYFAWGETEPKQLYGWETYSLCGGSMWTMKKYCTKDVYGIVDKKTELEGTDDAVTSNWGEGWQMPSWTQMDELLDKTYTTSVWTTQNEVCGLLVTSNGNGNSIFLPAAGYYDGETLYPEEANSYGMYWSRTLDSSDSYNARRMDFLPTFMRAGYTQFRSKGLSVRPVRVK